MVFIDVVVPFGRQAVKAECLSFRLWFVVERVMAYTLESIWL